MTGRGEDGGVPWLLHRVRGMPLAELPHRIREAGRRLRDRAAPAGGPRPPAPPGVAGGWPVPDCPVLSAGERERLERGARELLAGRLCLLGIQREGAELRAWHRDPETGTAWPRDVSAWAVPYRDPDRDVKVAWELQRLQHLQSLALAHRWLGRAEAGETCRRDVVDWWGSNPPFRGVAWGSGIECALRVVSLLVIDGALGEDRTATPYRRAVAEALSAHAAWLERYPSRFSSANNHRVAELGALVLLACLAPAVPVRRPLGELLPAFEDVVGRQFHPDGVGTEQSPTYQAFTMEWVLVVDAALRHVGRSLRPGSLDHLRRGVRHLRSLMDEGGHVPGIGDDDESVVLRPVLGAGDPVASVCGCVAARLGDGRLVPPGWTADARAALLHLPEPPSAVAPTSVSFPDGGITILRWESPCGPSRVVFDHGPLGFPSTGGHGHADALSIWWSVAGRPVLVDTGTYRYGGARAWRAWIRSTAAHNTLVVDGADQSATTGPFAWRRRATASRVDLALASREVAGCHDGYASRGVWHVRQVSACLVEALTVTDHVHGSGVHDLALYFHLAPELAPVRQGRSFVVDVGAAGTLTVRPDPALSATLVRGGPRPGPGWISRRYNELEEAPCLVLSGSVELPVRLRTVFELQGP